MSTSILNSAISNIESSITKLHQLNDVPQVSRIIESLQSIESDLYDLLNAKAHSFDRTKELKSILDTTLKIEGIGYNSALEIYKESNIHQLLSYQFDKGFNTLSNGERVGTDFRVILHLYLNS
jgi:ribosomal protein S13